MKKAIFAAALLLFTLAGWAQIPAEVTDVMDRCRAVMINGNGLEYESDITASLGPLSTKMHFVLADKGDLSRMVMSMKLMGKDVLVESGFDGTDTWRVHHSSKGDTITITRGNNKEKNAGDFALDCDKKYRKAQMKRKEGYYEITFSEPKEKDTEAKSITLKISDKNYTLREMRSSIHGARVTITIAKIRVGLKDSYFKLDLSKYPNAVVVRK